jgi:hypothetical protein
MRATNESKESAIRRDSRWSTGINGISRVRLNKGRKIKCICFPAAVSANQKKVWCKFGNPVPFVPLDRILGARRGWTYRRPTNPSPPFARLKNVTKLLGSPTG